MRRPAVVLAAVAVLAGAAPATAQVTVHRVTVATAATPAAEKALGALRLDLTKLVTAQEEYFARHSTYAWDLSQLGFAPAGGGRFVVRMAGPKGFHVDATHAQLKGTESLHVMREAKEGGMGGGGHDMGGGGEHASHGGGGAGGAAAGKGCDCACRKDGGGKAGAAAGGQHQH